MKIVVSCETMLYLSGSPLYNYTLAKELSKNHEVSLLSNWKENKLKSDLELAGVKCISSTNEEYDLALVSQRTINGINAKKVVNIVHSEYECENPMDNCDHYIAIRPSIKEHLIKEHGISEDKITVIYNGIDLDRFVPLKKSERDYIKVVIPATIDNLRQKLFDYLTSKASDKFRLFFYGNDYGGKIPRSEFITITPETNDIEKHIADADIVAGILLGRVNLEARACDVVSYIHNPDNPEEYEVYYPYRWDFEERHDIKNVVNKILDTYAKL